MDFATRVRNIVNGEAETKEKVVNIFNQSPVIGTGLTAGTTGLYQANLLDTLQVAQGTEQEQRNGNKISDARLRVRGVIQSLPYDGTNNDNLLPYEVHMVAYKEKKTIVNNPSAMKQLPNNITGDVDGTLINSCYPYNKDTFIFRKIKTFRLRPIAGEYPAAGGGNQLINTQTSNAPMFIRFHETIDIHKELKYQDAATVPSNDWVGVAFYVINGDGATMLPPKSRCKITMDAVLRYKDI
jgi:hypothetical protein